jgi:isoleucyl-tRNA synthetase
VLAELHALAGDVDERLESYDTAGAGRLLADFVDDLSNWYVRRSRQRFWDGEPDALATLYECLHVLTRLLAPIIPFITEEVWQRVVRPGDSAWPESVHLSVWPQVAKELLDPTLSEQMRAARSLAEAGRAARKGSSIRLRQPLGRAYLGLAPGVELPPALLDEVAVELNIKRLEPLSSAGEVVDVTVKGNFRPLGARFGKRTQFVAKAIAAADPKALVAQLRADGQATVVVDGEPTVIEPDEVLVTEAPRSGWVVESQRGVTIALDIHITAELAAEGIARDVVRVVQQARREAGLEISDRIALTVAAPPDILAAVHTHQDYLAHETLSDAVTLTEAGALDDGFEGIAGPDVPITVAVVKH